MKKIKKYIVLSFFLLLPIIVTSCSANDEALYDEWFRVATKVVSQHQNYIPDKDLEGYGQLRISRETQDNHEITITLKKYDDSQFDINALVEMNGYYIEERMPISKYMIKYGFIDANYDLSVSIYGSSLAYGRVHIPLDFDGTKMIMFRNGLTIKNKEYLDINESSEERNCKKLSDYMLKKGAAFFINYGLKFIDIGLINY